ncbi:MAG: DUF805 domain-containing protein [Marinibacterium sp.]
MGLGAAIRTCFRKALTFSGRAARPEFWWFVVFVLLGGLAAAPMDHALFGPGPMAPVTNLFHLVILLPLLAAAWRRMHDTGRSGLFVLYPLIVLVGLSSFVSFLGVGVDSLAQDGVEVWATQVQGALAALGGVVAVIAAFVLMISPLLVLWWLSRPSEPRANRWGPVPGLSGNAPRSGPSDTGPWS